MESEDDDSEEVEDDNEIGKEGGVDVGSEEVEAESDIGALE